MRLTLKRFADFGDGGMLGRLSMGGVWECWTLECSWRPDPNGSEGGQRYVSCVPGDGTLYSLEEHHGDKYSGTLALVNRDVGVSHWEEPGMGRFTCVFHTARFASQLQGCVSPGMALYLDTGRPMLASRGAAMRHILDYVGLDDQHELVIESCLGGYET